MNLYQLLCWASVNFLSPYLCTTQENFFARLAFGTTHRLKEHAFHFKFIED